LKNLVLLGPVVQSWIGANPALTFNTLFWFRCSAYILEKKTSADPDKISERKYISLLIKKLLGILL
jgi:hypothetical protein